MIQYRLLNISLLLLTLSIISCNNTYPNSIHLKKWKILYNHDADLTSVQMNEEWIPIEVPFIIQPSYSVQKNIQYVWIRSQFYIAQKPESFFGITIGRLFHIDDVYINGHRVGYVHINELANLHHPRSYEIPQGILKKGKNDVFIRIGIITNFFGGVFGNIHIHPHKEFKQVQIQNSLFFEIIPLGIVIFIIVTLMSAIITFLFHKKEKIFLYFILLLSFYIINILSLFTPYRFLPINVIISLHWASIPIFAIISILVIQSLYKVILPMNSHIVMPTLLIITLIILVSSISSVATIYIGQILGSACVIVIFPYFFYMLHVFNTIKPDKRKYYFLQTVCIINTVFTNSAVILYYIKSRYVGLLTTYLSPFFITCMAIIIYSDFIDRWKNIESLYNGLKGEFKTDKNLSITDTTENKLQIVIDFLKINFMSDISREGIAKAVDLNPKYMSRLFVSYTGKKVSDYINELRINEACNQLKNNNIKIIDIAFHVGFDSLATFNRSFKKIMGINPTEYRKNNTLE